MSEMTSVPITPPPALFASLLIGVPIHDRGGERLAAVHDLIARLDLTARERYPPLTGLVAYVAGREVFMPWSLVGRIGQDGVWLAHAAMDLGRFERRTGEVLLKRDLLDKQLVDVNGHRIIRASDVLLAVEGARVRVVGVDVGFAALWRRAAPRPIGRRVGSTDLIDWEDVEYLAPEGSGVRLRGGHPKIARLHPVEIAALIEELPNRLGAVIVESLDDATAADVVEELPEERQADIVEHLDQERAADVLEEMEPDVAADVLGDMPEETASELLAEMEPEEAADVRELLLHEEGTAGALMTNWVATLPHAFTAGEAIESIRRLAERPPFMHDLYVVDGDNDFLVGVISLVDLVCADPAAPLATLLRADPIRATPETPLREVAERIAEYNLLALPVVADDGGLLGIVTVDDVMDELVSDDGPRRFPRLFG
jgi:CBS domain-containing protein